MNVRKCISISGNYDCSVQGAVFHNPNFKFHDGEIGNKLLVLLNTPAQNESCLFVKISKCVSVLRACEKSEAKSML